MSCGIMFFPVCVNDDFSCLGLLVLMTTLITSCLKPKPHHDSLTCLYQRFGILLKILHSNRSLLCVPIIFASTKIDKGIIFRLVFNLLNRLDSIATNLVYPRQVSKEVNTEFSDIVVL